jgi:hypothetical protein
MPSAADAYFSQIVLASHDDEWSVFERGGDASPGLASFATTGDTALFFNELLESRQQAHVGDVFTSLQRRVPSQSSAAGGPIVMDVVVDSKHPHISLFTSIQPSSDWLLTGDSINLCNTETGTWLRWVQSRSRLSITLAFVNHARFCQSLLTFATTHSPFIHCIIVFFTSLSEFEVQMKIVDMARTAGTDFTGTAAAAPGEKIAEVESNHSSGASLPPLATVRVNQRVQPPCSASGSRTYKMRFQGTALPGRSYPADFSFGEVFGMAHGPDADLFDVGGTINNGIQTIVESDDSTDADGVLQLQRVFGHVGDSFTSPAGVTVGKDGSVEIEVRVTRDHPYVSFLSRALGSPDWFVGVPSLALCDGDQWLQSVTVRLPLLGRYNHAHFCQSIITYLAVATQHSLFISSVLPSFLLSFPSERGQRREKRGVPLHPMQQALTLHFFRPSFVPSFLSFRAGSAQGETWSPSTPNATNTHSSFLSSFPPVDAGSAQGDTWGPSTPNANGVVATVARVGVDTKPLPLLASSTGSYNYAEATFTLLPPDADDNIPCSGSAVFTMQFNGHFDRNRFPRDFPDNGAFFGRVVGATHVQDMRWLNLNIPVNDDFAAFAEENSDKELLQTLRYDRSRGFVGDVFTGPSETPHPFDVFPPGEISCKAND